MSQNKMAASDAAVGFWNHRGLLTSWQACPKRNLYKERVDEDVLKDTINSLTLLHIKLKQTQLWAEFAIIKRIVYKNGNQHRKQFYFHGLRRIVKNLNRLQEIGISKKLADVRNSFPSLPKHGFITDTPPNYPSVRLIVNILGCLTGAAQIILQVSSFCQETFKFSCSELLSGYFLTFHLTLVSSLSRVWVFLKDFLYAVAGCYDIIFPWLNLLQDTQKMENSEAKDLPKSLKIWLEPLDNNKTYNSTSVTPAKTLTPGALDKLFASTPRQKPEDTSPRFLPANADSSTQPCDLGESFVPDDINRPLKPSGVLIADDFSNLKTKLFPENPVELHNQEHCSQVNSNDSTLPKKRKATEFLDSELSNTKLKRFVIRGGLCRHSCTTIHIFGNKTWKLSVERKLRKKLAQRALKTKQRRAKARRDASSTKKRKRETSSRDDVFTKKKRAATGEEETRSKRKAKKKTGRDAAKTKMRKRETSSRNDVFTKKKRVATGEEETRSKRKAKKKTGRDAAKTKMRKRETSSRDDVFTKKKRGATGEEETRSKRKAKKKTGRDAAKTKMRKRETSSRDDVFTKKKRGATGEEETRSKRKAKKKTGRDAAKTKMKKRETSSRDDVFTKKKRAATGEEETRSKKKAQKKTGRGAVKTKKKKEEKSRDSIHVKVEGETRRKRKRKLGNVDHCKDEISVKKKRKEETSGDLTNKQKKMKESGKYNTKIRFKKRREKTRKDKMTTKKKRKEKCGKDEAMIKKQRKEKSSKDETKSKRKRSGVSKTRKDKNAKHETHSKTTTSKAPCKDVTGTKKKGKPKLDKQKTPKEKTNENWKKMRRLKKRKRNRK